MPIVSNSLLSSTVANNTFLDKTIDDIKTGVLTLRKFEGDGSQIVDVQVSLNSALQQAANNNAAIDLINDTIAGGEIRLKAYANDAAYEAENGAPPYTDLTGVYYNSTDGKIRYYNDVDAQWDEVGSSGVGYHESLGTGNGATVDFSITNLPLTDDSFIVYLNGNMVSRSEYTFSNPTITFNTAPAAGQVVEAWVLSTGSPSVVVAPSGTQIVEYHTLTAGDITAKEITIPSAPVDVTKVILDVISGSSQHYGVDFSVSGTTLTWNGLGLDGNIIAGDVLRYHYFS